MQSLGASVAASFLGSVGLEGLITYDLANGGSPSGSGRAGPQQWETESARDVEQQIFQAVGNQDTGVRSLIVNWDTYGSIDSPAQVVAQRIQQIVADAQFDGQAWNLLFIGYSRARSSTTA